jgi:hypothetical protein
LFYQELLYPTRVLSLLIAHLSFWARSHFRDLIIRSGHEGQ